MYLAAARVSPRLPYAAAFHARRSECRHKHFWGFFHPAALPSSTVLDMLIRWHSSELQRLRNSSPDPRVRAPTQPRAADAPAVLPQPQTGLSGFPLRDSLPPHRAPEVYNKPPWGKARDGKRKEMKKCGRFKCRKTTVWLHWRLH